MRYKITLIFVILYIFLMPKLHGTSGLQHKYYTPKNVLKFAEHLYREGEYLRAAGEYQRYLFLNESGPINKDEILYKIGLCYRLAKKLNKSSNYYESIIENFTCSKYCESSYIQLGFNYFSSGDYDKSILFLENNVSNINTSVGKLKMQQLIGLNFIYQKCWNETLDYLSSLSEEGKKDSYTRSLMNFAKEGINLPKKSSTLAGIMSAVVPGSGKVYGHRIVDGITSFLLVSFSGWLAYRGFKEDGTGSVKGWVYGSICTFFYLGNIYGSVVNIKIYNRQIENMLLKKISITIDVNFGL